MSDEEINKQLADLLGWEYTYGSASDEGFPWKFDGNHYEAPPNYCVDLNACHEAARKGCGANETRWAKYRLNLRSIVGGRLVEAIDASARHRALALLKTLSS